MNAPLIMRPSDAADLLDRPVWSTLATFHRRFALGDGQAKRMLSDIGPFAAACDNGRAGLFALEHLLHGCADGMVLMQVGELLLPISARVDAAAEGVQMLAEHPIARPLAKGILRLGEADVPEMRALARRAKPGPFHARTHRLGAFWGVRHEGRLIAMAGERMRQPGFTEISAVSVHPDHRGQGHGGRLVSWLAADIAAMGDTPYLHVFADNTNAIRLYERLGFRARRAVNIAWLKPGIGPRIAPAS